jgi:hypothetical protein
MESDFFSLPQNFGRSGLFLNKNIRSQYPLDCSDFLFEIGHVNEAERWASEAMTLYGESPDVLKRLALSGILRDEPLAATQFLKRLLQNPFSRSWADHYLSCLTDPQKLRKESLLQMLHAYKPRRDFLVVGDHTEIDLEKMLDQAPNNRMAFEYLMMSRMITRDLDGFINDLVQFKEFTKTSMPRLYEEAFIAYLALNKSAAVKAPRIKIRKATIAQFENFESILSNYAGNSEAAYNDLSRSYANTYWFYLLYAKPVTDT